MRKLRFHGIFSQFGKPLSEDARLHMEMLHYLDDRRWPVTVWYHDRCPEKVRTSRWLAHAYYCLRLFLLPASIVIIDSRLQPYLALILPLIRCLKRHRWLISYRDPSAAARPSLDFWRSFCRRVFLQSADLIITDAYSTRRWLADVEGVTGKIGVLFSDQDWEEPLRELQSDSTPIQPLRYIFRHPWKKIRKRFGLIIDAFAR